MTLTRTSRILLTGLLLLLMVLPVLFYLNAPFSSDEHDTPEARIASLIRVKKTHYPVPEDAIFVATNGIDNSACGPEDSPCRTVRFAALKAFVDSTLVIREGTYHEYVEFNKPLTIQPYPNEEVWLDGSQPVTDWVQDGRTWRHDNWRFLWTDEAGNPIGESVTGEFIDPAFPMSGWPDMVFVNGQNLQQVESVADVGPGRFFVDYSRKALYIGDDPSVNLVEAATLPIAMQIYDLANGTTIRGIGIRRYANPIRGGLGAMVHVHASQMVFENNTFAQSASAGFAMNFAKDSVVRGNIFVANGSIGSGGYKTDGLLFEGNYLAYNNAARFTRDWESGGAKMIAVQNTTIRGNIFEDNWATGYWCDLSCVNVTLVQNVFRNNDYNGITYEISHGAVIASNLVVNNRENGIMISGSDNATIANNTLVRNRRNIAVTDDSRVNADTAELAEGITWNTGNVEIYNNVLSDNDGTSGNRDLGSNFVMVSNFADGGATEATGESLISVLDHNAYFRSDITLPANLFSFWTGPGSTPRFWKYLPDLAAVRQAYEGFETHGIAMDDAGDNPWFEDEDDDDFRLAGDAEIRGKGKQLDATIAGVINGGLAEPVVTPGEAVDIGALVWADFDPVMDDWERPGE